MAHGGIFQPMYFNYNNYQHTKCINATWMFKIFKTFESNVSTFEHF